MKMKFSELEEGEIYIAPAYVGKFKKITPLKGISDKENFNAIGKSGLTHSDCYLTFHNDNLEVEVEQKVHFQDLREGEFFKIPGSGDLVCKKLYPYSDYLRKYQYCAIDQYNHVFDILPRKVVEKVNAFDNKRTTEYAKEPEVNPRIMYAD